MVDVQPLPGAFGAEVSGVDLSQPLSRALAKDLMEAFYRHQFLVLSDQRLEHADFDRFCAFFGKPKPHLLDHLRLPGHPDILTLSNIFEDGKPIGIYEGASFWHTDVAYDVYPNTATIAYSLEVPDEQPALKLANLALAYEALPEATKARIEGLWVMHHYGNRADMDEDSPYSAEKLTDEQKTKFHRVYQPLVTAHPVTGRKGLYAIAGSSFAIHGLPDDEGVALLDELVAHATQPDFVIDYRYRVGDIACWDTLSTLHKAPLTRPAQTAAERRLLWRISVTGSSPLFPEAAAFAGLSEAEMLARPAAVSSESRPGSR
ncbi:MAG: TauD/TfdA family dioxygenase [Rhodospirillales bacterium]